MTSVSNMTMNQYDNLSARTIGNWKEASPLHFSLCANGLTGESGEVADLIKKIFGHGHDFDAAKIERELGDVLWYVSAMAQMIGSSLERVAAANVAKLEARFPYGFDSERSKNRAVGDT